jgi:hypothetical protein
MNLKNFFLLFAVIFLAIGLGSMFMGGQRSSMQSMIEGLSKGLAGVFFILYYIFMLLGKQPTDKTAGH